MRPSLASLSGFTQIRIEYSDSAEVHDLAHAGHAVEGVVDVDEGVVAEEEGVVGARSGE